jgi:hypothetical protein
MKTVVTAVTAIVGLGLGNLTFQLLQGGSYATTIEHTWFEAIGIIVFCVMNKINSRDSNELQV